MCEFNNHSIYNEHAVRIKKLGIISILFIKIIFQIILGGEKSKYFSVTLYLFLGDMITDMLKFLMLMYI